VTKAARQFVEVVEEGNAARIVAILSKTDFTLFQVEGEAEDDDYEAMTAEVDDYPVLVAFSSTEHAGLFAGAMPDLFDQDKDAPGFVVGGRELMTGLPAEFGVLFNPESDDTCLLPPDLAAEVAAQFAG
jgi:hypothetical protein